MDNFTLNEQVIHIDYTFLKNIHLLAAANNGDYTIDLKIETFHSMKSLKIEIFDAVEDEEYKKNKKRLFLGAMNTANINTPLNFLNTCLWYYKISVNDNAKSIKFPFNSDVHIFAITIER